MANTSLTTAAVAGISSKLTAACAGGKNMPGASIKAFTATAGTGNFPIAGLTLDLSALFPNKVLAVVISALHDPAKDSGKTAYEAIYTPATDGNPATGKVYIYTTNTIVANDTLPITGFVVTGFAIGY